MASAQDEPERPGRATIRDVASRAGVSIATVSRVLSDKQHIRPEVRERVREAVAELGYRPNRVARQLRSRRSATLGLIVSDIRNPFFASVSRVVEDVASAHDYNVFLCNADEDPEKERRYLQVLNAQQVEGIVLSPTNETAQTLAEVAPPGIPLVVIDREVPAGGVDQIGIDNERAAHELCSTLFERGATRVAAVFGNASSTGIARHAGFLAAHRDRDLEPDPELSAFDRPTTEKGYEQTKRYLARTDRPDALFASNGTVAAGVARAIHEAGLKIGQDILLGCFDRPEWIDLLQLPVIAVEQPTAEIGKVAFELLKARIDEPGRATERLQLRHALSQPD